MRKRSELIAKPLEFSDLAARGGGGGRTKIYDYRNEPLRGMELRTEQLKRSVDRSIEERGGYPTRNGKPLMTKMQQRALERQRRDYAKGGKVK